MSGLEATRARMVATQLVARGVRDPRVLDAMRRVPDVAAATAALVARLVARAERYYRIKYHGSRASWNLRDAHMHVILLNLLQHCGSGSKAGASDRDGPLQVMQVRPSHPQSHEHAFHLRNRPGLILPLGRGRDDELARALGARRLERAIGVIYRPESELASDYVEAELSHRFDECVWIDETRAVTPLPAVTGAGMPDTWPFGV